jgi:hypothetical protein
MAWVQQTTPERRCHMGHTKAGPRMAVGYSEKKIQLPPPRVEQLHSSIGNSGHAQIVLLAPGGTAPQCQ